MQQTNCETLRRKRLQLTFPLNQQGTVTHILKQMEARTHIIAHSDCADLIPGGKKPAARILVEGRDDQLHLTWGLVGMSFGLRMGGCLKQRRAPAKNNLSYSISHAGADVESSHVCPGWFAGSLWLPVLPASVR